MTDLSIKIDHSIIEDEMDRGTTPTEMVRKYGWKYNTIVGICHTIRKRRMSGPFSLYGFNQVTKTKKFNISDDELIRLWNKHESVNDIARSLHISHTTLWGRWKALQERGILQDSNRPFSPKPVSTTPTHPIENKPDYYQYLRERTNLFLRLLYEAHGDEPRYDIAPKIVEAERKQAERRESWRRAGVVPNLSRTPKSTPVW